MATPFQLPDNTQNLLIQSLGDLHDMALLQLHPSVDRCTFKQMGGKGVKQPIVFGYGGGVSTDFETGLANAQENIVVDDAFEIDPAVVYGHDTIEWTSAKYTKDSDTSAIDLATLATKAATYNAGHNFAAMMFGDGSGALAQIETATNTAGNLWTLKLVNEEAVGLFAINGKVRSKLTPFAATLDTGTWTVKGLGQIGGFIRVDTGGSGVPTAGHYLGVEGQIAASTAVVTFPGIFGYIPSSDARDSSGVPLVTSFLGVERGLDSPGIAVSGWAIDGQGQPVFVTMNTLGGKMANYKEARCDTAYVNGADLSRLSQELNIDVVYDMPSRRMEGKVFYSGFRVNLGCGTVEVMAEPACPAGYMVMCQANQWHIGSPNGTLLAPANPHGVMIHNYAKNISRFSVEASGFFTTPNPVGTGILKF